MIKNIKKMILGLVLLLTFTGCTHTQAEEVITYMSGKIEELLFEPETTVPKSSMIKKPGILDEEKEYFSLENVPEYSYSPYVEINGNIPYFNKEEVNVKVSFEIYGQLDAVGRCTSAYANIGADLMPTEERGQIGSIKPTGWHTVKYPEVITDNYLYNRCHLIAYCLTGENANEENLITGTRYMNVEGMLPFETAVAKYLDNNKKNHVLYRVTPIFYGANLVADGVLMEAYSVEDNGAGICFCVFVYNVQPGIIIDYATGGSRLAD